MAIATHITTFTFYTKELTTLNEDMTKEIGYLPSAWNIWSLDISDGNSNGLKVTISITGYKPS